MAHARMPEAFFKLAAHHLPPEQPVGREGGRPCLDHRVVLKVLWFVLTTGCRWEDVPPELGCSGMTAHRCLRRWEEMGVWDRLHVDLLRLLRQADKLDPDLVIVDAVARLIPGVVGDQQSVVDDSFNRGLLDFPQYTRPAEMAAPAEESPHTVEGTAVEGMRVPEVLLSGNHAAIRRWRKREAVARTFARRPDLLDAAALDDEERAILRELKEQEHERH